MTESTQLQTTENNNTGVVKMEPPPPLSTSPAPSSGVDQHYNQQQRQQHEQQQQQQQQQLYQQHQQLLQQKQQQQQQQHYALKWNDFQSSILSSFRHLRDEEDFVDVTLACDERSFTAHKVVLSACSPYFRKLLKANPCEHPIVILRDVRSEDVENLLSFMYNGEVNVSQEQLTDFLKTANLLQIRGLADVNGSGSVAPLKLNSPSINLNNNNNNNNNSSSISCNNHHNNNNNNNNNNKNKNNLNNKLSFGGNGISGAIDSNLLPFLSSSITLAAVTDVTNVGNNNNNNSSSNNSAIRSTSLQTLSSSLTSTTTTTGTATTATTTPATTLSNTPAVQELKASSSSSPVRKPINNKANHHWDLSDPDNNKTNHLTPPPQKRIKSADLFRAQHGISPERLLIDREFSISGQHPLTRDRHRDRDCSRETSRDRERDRSLELRDSLLSQALENSNGQHAMHSNNMDQKQHNDLASLHAQSAGEESNSSDTEPSDRGDGQLLDGTMDSMNGGGGGNSLDNQRSHSFPSAFLGLQGIPGLLPGPSGMHGGANDFVSRRSLEMRVRATDPRPCPKCGKIYRSAHTLRTHLEDKHTVCPGYRCVLCGTVAKSRNSLHSHMSRQHRGISTKDLPVLPMPSPFDPELASRLLAKAGVKISPAELRARASPTSGNGNGNNVGLNGSNLQRNNSKLDLHGNVDDNDEDDDDDDDPEDLTIGNVNGGNNGNGLYGMNNCNSNNNNDLSRYHDNLLGGFNHANTTITRIRNEAAAAAAAAAVISQKNDLVGNHISATTTTAGQSLLDTYLQFITENTFGMGMTQEHAAAAALHAAKMAQLNAIGHHGLDKIPSSLLAPQFDLSKITAQNNNNNNNHHHHHNNDVTSRLVNNFGNSTNHSSVSGNGGNGNGLTIEPILKREQNNSNTNSSNSNTNNSNNNSSNKQSSSIHENDLLTPTTTVTTTSTQQQQQQQQLPSSTITSTSTNPTDIRRDSSEPMDLGLDNNNQSGSGNSECDDNYSEDEGVHNT